MPSQKPRLNLTLDDELNEVITDLSRLMKIPKTRIITDLLKDILPVMKEMRNALELVEQKKSAVPNLARLAASANDKTGIINSEMAELLSQYSLEEGTND